jgi:hypothetical protein
MADAARRVTRGVSVELPFLDQALVPDSKLVSYLLNPLHPKGRSKAAFLLQLGFASERPDDLRQALLELAARTDMEEIVFPYGLKYTGVGLLRTPRGTEVVVRTVWALLDGLSPPLFVTAYPAHEREGT